MKSRFGIAKMTDTRCYIDLFSVPNKFEGKELMINAADVISPSLHKFNIYKTFTFTSVVIYHNRWADSLRFFKSLPSSGTLLSENSSNKTVITYVS